ncbi:MAG: hypothetical protein P8080_04990 [Gammaproteobacteria bacterium]
MEVFLQWLDDIDDVVLAIGHGLASAEARLTAWLGAAALGLAALAFSLAGSLWA